MDLYNTPAAPPPPGVVPHLGPGAASQQKAIIGVCVTMIALTTMLVAIRVYVAAKIIKQNAMENYFCIFACILSFAYLALLIHLSYISRHQWDTPAAWLFLNDSYWKLRFSQNLLQPAAFFFSRLPIFLLFRRIFGATRWFRRACWVGIIAAFVIYIHTIPLVAASCYPRNGDSWTSLDTFARCKSSIPDSIAQGAGNILLDLYALLLPLPVIWTLKLSPRRKIGVAVVFLTGVFALVASITSFYYRYQLSFASDDTNWNEGAYDASSAVEINVAIICSCMPSVRSLLHTKSSSAGSRFVSLSSVFRSWRPLGVTRIESIGPLSEAKMLTDLVNLDDSHQRNITTASTASF